MYHGPLDAQKPLIIENVAESDKAALTIQTKFRQTQAKSTVDEKRRHSAAVKIQSAGRGYLGRKRVARLRVARSALLTQYYYSAYSYR